jgi:tRNA 2-thiouridine synthesizing protein E
MSSASGQEQFMVGGVVINLDSEGFMTDEQQWSRVVADALAQRNGLTLTEEHWKIIQFVRDYHDAYAIEPPMRALVKALAALIGKAAGNSRFLYQLFPDGPIKEASRYAGLAKPLSCI